MSQGRSFRPTENKSLIQFHDHATPFSASSKITAQFEHRNLGYKVSAQIQTSKKEFFVNQKKVYPRELQSLIPMVLFSPESLSVIKESSEQRRSLVDELILSQEPRQAKIMAEFSRALRARNALLKDISKTSLREDQQLSLESLNQIYLVLATHMTQLRVTALKRIWADFEEAINFIFGSPQSGLRFEYLVSGQVANDWNEEKSFAFLQTRMAELRLQEYGAGHSLVGPHKHDIKFLFAENDSRFYCSQGQQRALILALKIAQIVYHQRVHQKYPILLLDDVLSELDESKRLNLMKFLGKVSAQVLITATDVAIPEMHREMHESNRHFVVQDGRVRTWEEMRSEQECEQTSKSENMNEI